ncbi:MAG: hypothetical protein IJD59_02940 [Clostridia bacterium]|nr:hypothetical protein [Clostridia bacterium]
MKTMQWLKKSFRLQIIYACCCIASSLCFAIFHYFQADAFLALGCLFVYGWFLAPITVIRGFSLYFSERGQDRDRRIIGKKWLWFIAFVLADTVLFCIAGGLTVLFTGGV